MKRKHPNLQITIKTSYNHQHISSLEEGNIDFLVDAEPKEAGDFDSFAIFTDYFSFYTEFNSSDKKVGKIDSSPLIFVPSAFDEQSKSLKMYVSESNLRKNEKIELDSFTTARTFSEEGLGIAILPNRLEKSSVKKKLISPVSMINLTRNKEVLLHYSVNRFI